MDNNEIPIGIFLDLSKAFDTINHKILLSKLKYYGISGVPLQLLDNYLTNRFQYVVIKSIKSNTLQITTGVPQGSILGPLLFLIYINDFSQSSLAFNFISYADDTTLFSTLGNFNNTGSNVERDNLINSVHLKINEWLEINISKCKCMLFHMPSKTMVAPLPQINNINIEKVEYLNFLGFTLDTHLNWKNHSNNVANKCSRTIGVLNRLKYTLPLRIKIMLYNTLIIYHVNYYIMVWGYQHTHVRSSCI